MKELPLNFNRDTDKTLVGKENSAIVEKALPELFFVLKELESRYKKGELEIGYKNTMLSLVESYCCNLFESLDFESHIKTERDERYKDTKIANEQNRELRKLIGAGVTNEAVRERVKLISNAISQWWKDEIGGYVKDFSMGAYGYVKFSLSCHISGIGYEGNEAQLFDMAIAKGYDCEKEESTTFALLNNEKNLMLIQRKLKESFPSAIIQETSGYCGARKAECVLRDVNVMIYNLDEINVTI